MQKAREIILAAWFGPDTVDPYYAAACDRAGEREASGHPIELPSVIRRLGSQAVGTDRRIETVSAREN
jgi:hypothetical protein